MPRLYGAPAYSRPPRRVDVQRPFDPDDMPLESDRSLGDHAARHAEVSAIPFEDQGEDADRASVLSHAALPFGFSNRSVRAPR